jgi:hypothetical protein
LAYLKCGCARAQGTHPISRHSRLALDGHCWGVGRLVSLAICCYFSLSTAFAISQRFWCFPFHWILGIFILFPPLFSHGVPEPGTQQKRTLPLLSFLAPSTSPSLLLSEVIGVMKPPCFSTASVCHSTSFLWFLGKQVRALPFYR